ncbi:conserved hypothetical protein [Trichinella spiralis]|uniref:hypothetical protein n=1 Tax=Trichinella spiralis TaxID=6334 RepID=UPI0001EFB975|nr:conserved hypothetical protein [Trichinella spiralis]
MASRFLTLENAIDYLETLPPEDQINAEVCQLPPCEDGNLTDEEHIEEDDLDEVMPLDVCGEVDVTVDSDRIVNEDDVTTNKGYGYNSKCQNTQLPPYEAGIPKGNHHPFIAREAIRNKPPRATVTLTNKTPDFVRALPPIMCPWTMCSLPKKLQK